MLRVRDARVRYEAAVALDGVDLDVADDEVMALVGPSGSGKTTLLRVIAGLEPAEEGTVHWDDEELTSVPTHRRGFGLMFQDYALFPHRDVAGNVAFGLRMQGRKPDEASSRVREVLALVGLAGFASRRVGTLSGGEQQRVALARALAPNPRLLMLDEPLGSLDRPLRERLIVELGELLSRLDIAAIYVTHDQEEAFAVADRLTLMHEGRVVQTGTAAEVWRRPVTEFAARFLGFGEAVDAAIHGGVAATPWGPLRVAGEVPDGPARLVLRPDALSLHPTGEITGTVVSRTFRGGHSVIRVQPPAGPALETVITSSVAIGDTVRIAVAPDGVISVG